MDGQAAESAERLVQRLGQLSLEVAALLRAVAEDPQHPFMERIERATVYIWYATPEEWALFQGIARRIADGIETGLDVSSLGHGSAQ